MRIYAVAALLLSLWQSPASIAPQEPAAQVSIEGTVTIKGTSEPVPGALLTFASGKEEPDPTDPGSSGKPDFITIRTDAQGRFRIANRNAGWFTMTVAANGYSKQFWPEDPTRPIRLAAGQALKDVVIALVPAGVVSGTIRDESGRPAVGVQAELWLPAYDFNGRRSFAKVRSAPTDDRGEYRLFNITPGRYYMTAGSTADPFLLSRSLESDPNTVHENYAFSYYPGVNDIQSASLIEIRPGSNTTADFNVHRQDNHRIRGGVIDSRTGAPPDTARIWIEAEDLSGHADLAEAPATYNKAAGTFEIRDVPPGSYVIRAGLTEANPPGPPSAEIAVVTVIRTVDLDSYSPPPGATARVTVSRADIDGVLLNIVAPATVSGRLTMEGLELSTVPEFERIQVVMNAVDRLGVRSILHSVNLKSDGTFRIENVMPGEYRVTTCIAFKANAVGCARNTPDFYLKSVRFDSTDALSKPLHFPATAATTLDVVLGPKPAQIAGIVTNEKQQPAAEVPVALIPDQRDRIDLYKFGATDDSGSFAFHGITPGSYKIFSAEDLKDTAYFDTNLLRQFDPLGKPARLSESEKAVVDLKLIPAVK